MSQSEADNAALTTLTHTWTRREVAQKEFVKKVAKLNPMSMGGRVSCLPKKFLSRSQILRH